MDIPSEEDIELMDKFLKGKFENRKYSLNNSWYGEQFGLDNKNINRILNLIGEYADLERLATTEIIDGEFFIVSFDEFKTEKFIRNDGFKSYFDAFKEEIVAESEYKNNLRDSAKPKKWYKKTEFIVSSIIGIIALVIPFITRHLDKKEPNELIKKTEIQAKVDSIYKASRNYSDSLFYLTNKPQAFETDSLNNSYDSIFKN